jgi:hypothetical protein
MFFAEQAERIGRRGAELYCQTESDSISSLLVASTGCLQKISASDSVRLPLQARGRRLLLTPFPACHRPLNVLSLEISETRALIDSWKVL